MNEERDLSDLDREQAEQILRHLASQGAVADPTEAARRLVVQAARSTSMEAIHELIEGARRVGPELAEAILETVASRLSEDTGAITGDFADFHNVATEAARANLYAHGRHVIRAGIEQNGDHPVLVGDAVQFLRACGRPREAITEAWTFWRRTPPKRFSTDWRVAVFFKNSVETIDPSFDEPVEVDLLPDPPKAGTSWGDAVGSVLGTLQENEPNQIRAWTEMAEVREAQGDLPAAIELLHRGAAVNPYNQMVYFALGERLLVGSQSADDAGGRRLLDEAIAALERALRANFERNYQTGFNPLAVTVRLAQAYEAKSARYGDVKALTRARGIYEQLRAEEESPLFHNFALARLRHIRTYVDVSQEFEEPSDHPSVGAT